MSPGPEIGPPTLRQLLERGWTGHPLESQLPHDNSPLLRIGPNQQLPVQPPGGRWLDAGEAFYEEGKNRAANPPPPSSRSLTPQQIHNGVLNRLRSARSQLQAIEGGWGNRYARWNEIADRLGVRDRQRFFAELEQGLGEAKARVAKWEQEVMESRNRSLQAGRGPTGPPTNPLGNAPGRTTGASGPATTPLGRAPGGGEGHDPDARWTSAARRLRRAGR